MCIFQNDGGQKALAAQQQRQADEARADANRKAGSLQTGMGNIDKAFGGFDDNYFGNLSKSYIDYAQPQVDDQYNEAKKNITYALARHGNLNSSVAGDQASLLDKQYATNEEGIQGAAQDYANTARRDVQANKQDVIGQLNSSYDADAANSSALSAAKALAVPQSFSPLGNLFTNVSALAAQNKLASDGGGYGFGASPGVRVFGGGYGSGGSAGRVVN